MKLKKVHLKIVVFLALVGALLFVSGSNAIKDSRPIEGDLMYISNDSTGLSPYEAYAKADFVTKIDKNGVTYHEINIFGAILPGSLSEPIAKIRDLIINDVKDPLVININSPGGSASDMFEFITVVGNYSGTVITVNEGIALSAGAVIYAQGDVRVAGSHSQTLFHSVQMGYMGRINFMIVSSMLQQIKDFNQTVYDYLVFETGQSEEQLRKTIFIEIKEDNWLNVAKLKEYKLMDLSFLEFKKILFNDGILAVVALDNHQDDPSASDKVVGVVNDLVEKVQNAVSQLF